DEDTMKPQFLQVPAYSIALRKPSIHDFHYIYGCYEYGEVRVDVLVDDEVAAYADFSKDEVVFAIPHLPQSVPRLKKEAYALAKANISIYSRYEGEDGVVNTLFCLANHFYPPSINFTWTKNGVEVTEGVSNLRYRHNGDGTFHRISTLSFTPREGDVHSCSVEHPSLHRPLARSWGRTKSCVCPLCFSYRVRPLTSVASLLGVAHEQYLGKDY
uniref:Ig-like domain-containing protein n=1 Tax=Sander lucioperca TaxID=283035 RepID=A0A8D0D0W1_SANLU